MTWENLVYQDYHYPWWAHAVGYFMAASSMLCIPGYAIWLWVTTPGTWREVRILLLSRYHSSGVINIILRYKYILISLQKMDTIVSPTLDLAEIRPSDSDAAQHSKLTHI